jgi:Siphovirus Gp157
MSQLDPRFIEQAKAALHHLLVTHPELEEDEVLRLDMIEGSTNFMELLDELIEADREIAGLEEGLEAVIDRFLLRKQRFASNRLGIRKFAMQLMEAAGQKTVKRPAGTISIAAGRPKVLITDETAIPPAYTRTKVEIDKESIAKTLKALGEVPGTTLSNAEPVLRIS